MFHVQDKSVLITGANRGIGAALVEVALERGASRVYATTRGPATHTDPRVVALGLDLTDTAQIDAAAAQVESLDILVNNAGIALYDDLTDPDAISQQIDVNVLGPLALTQSLLPQLTASASGGRVVNNLSINALAPLPMIPGYSLSKAAAFSMTQSLRSLLAPRGIRVHAVLTGPTDTDMSRGVDIPKASPHAVAQAIYDGVGNGEDDIFPDPMSAQIAEGWHTSGAKILERQYAEFAAAAASVAQ